MNDSVTVIIPAYNEERSIENVCTQLWEKCSRHGWRLLVVDDGSTDRTGEIVRGMGIDLVEHAENLGYGAALKSGIRHAETEWIMIIDADGTYPPEAVSTLAEHADGADMVVAARTGENVRMPFLRRPAKWFIGKLANYLTRRRIPDLNSGLRLFRKELAEKFIRILPDGFSFTTTITLAALTNGYRVEYVPVDYMKRTGKSKIRPIYDTLNFVQLIFRTILYFEPLRIFVPLSLCLFFASFCVLVGSYFLVHRIHDATTVLLAIAGLQILAIGMIADLIDKRFR